MFVTYTLDQTNFPSLEVGEDMELENFYALISMETPALSGINISDVFFMINGNKSVLNPENLKKTLKVGSFGFYIWFRIFPYMEFQDVGISNNDLIYVGVSRAPAPTQRLPATPGTSTGSTDASQLISQLVKSIKVPPKATKKPANAEFNPNTLASSPDFRKQVKQMFLALDNRITQIRLKDQHPRAVEQYLKDPKDFGELNFNEQLVMRIFIQIYIMISQTTNILSFQKRS